MRERVFVVVQHVERREAALRDTLASLRASDIGAPDAIVTQKPGEGMHETFLATLRAANVAARAWTLRLEDDVLVNRHILTNLLAWPALDEEDFGAGWAFCAYPIAMGHAALTWTEAGNVCRAAPELVGSLGVWLCTADLDGLIPMVEREWQRANGQQDVALSRACWAMQRRVYLHLPQLVEHNLRHQSTLAPDRPHEPMLHSTFGGFEPDWVRA